MNFLTPGNVKEVETDGFTVVSGAVDPKFAGVLRQKLADMAAEQRVKITERTKLDDYMVHNPMARDKDFMDVLESPAIVEALDTFLGDTSLIYACTTSSMPVGGTNYSNRIHVDSPRIIPGYTTNLGVILALDDFTEENGATYYLPGSFERADQPSEEEFFANAARVFPKRGDLVVFNARTWHLGGQNRTDNERHALTLNACRAYMRQRWDYPRLLGNDTMQALSPTLQRLLGYNVRVPASVEEYYLPEEQRLYKANQG